MGWQTTRPATRRTTQPGRSAASRKRRARVCHTQTCTAFGRNSRLPLRTEEALARRTVASLEADVRA